MAAVTIYSDFEAPKIKSVTVSTVSPSICHEVMGPDAMILVLWMLSFNGDLLQNDLCQHAVAPRIVVDSVPDPEAGHCRPMHPPETSGHSQASLGQSLVGSLLHSPGSWCAQGFVCFLQESVSPVLCKFCNQIPLVTKVKSLGVLNPFVRSPGWEISHGS